MVYKASLDKMALVITMGITVLFTVIIGSQFSEYVETGQTASLVAALICLLIYVTAFIFRPLRYSITAEELIIHRPLWNVRLKRSRIRSAVLVDKKSGPGLDPNLWRRWTVWLLWGVCQLCRGSHDLVWYPHGPNRAGHYRI